VNVAQSSRTGGRRGKLVQHLAGNCSPLMSVICESARRRLRREVHARQRGGGRSVEVTIFPHPFERVKFRAQFVQRLPVTIPSRMLFHNGGS